MFFSPYLPIPIGHQTPQLPPYPMDTLSPSTITGTFRSPPECLSISFSLASSFLTSKYSASFPKAEMAFSVKGQPALPYIMTLFFIESSSCTHLFSDAGTAPANCSRLDAVLSGNDAHSSRHCLNPKGEFRGCSKCAWDGQQGAPEEKRGLRVAETEKVFSLFPLSTLRWLFQGRHGHT